MAPCQQTVVASGRSRWGGDRGRCVRRARKSLIDAIGINDAADDGPHLANVDSDAPRFFTGVLERRLGRAVREAKQQVLEQAPHWHHIGNTSQLRVPHDFLAAFAEQVVRTVNRWGEHESQELAASYQRRLHENRRTYLQEFDAYELRKERHEPHGRSAQTMPEEELYLWEPMQYWNEDQQAVMRHIVKERLNRSVETFQPQQRTLPRAEEDDEEVDLDALEDEADEHRRLEEEKRKKHFNDLRLKQEYDASVQKAWKIEQQINEDLQKQLVVVCKAADNAELLWNELLLEVGGLREENESKQNRHNEAIGEMQKQRVLQQQQQEKEAAAAAAAEAASAKEKAAEAAAEAAAAKSPGDFLLTYSWEEHLRTPFADALENERIFLGICEEDWQQRVLVLSRGERPMHLGSALSQNDFPIVLKLQAPVAVAEPVKSVPRVERKQVLGKLQAPDKEELARRVSEACRAEEEERAEERAKLQARTRELEDAIAQLQSQRRLISRSVSDVSSASEPRPKAKAHVLYAGRQRAQSRLSGEVKIVKAAVTRQDTGHAFAQLHGDAEQKLTRASIKGIRDSVMNALQNAVEELQCGKQLFAAQCHLTTRRDKRPRSATVSSLPERPSSAASMSRPRSATVAASPERPSSAKPKARPRSETAPSGPDQFAAQAQPARPRSASAVCIARPRSATAQCRAERPASASAVCKARPRSATAQCRAERPASASATVQRDTTSSLRLSVCSQSVVHIPTLEDASRERPASASATVGRNMSSLSIGKQAAVQHMTLEDARPGRPASASATVRRSTSSLIAGKQAPVPRMTLEDVLDHRGNAELAGSRTAASPDAHDGVCNGAASQWGASVLHNPSRPVSAGPGRTSLFKAVFEQHLGESGVEGG